MSDRFDGCATLGLDAGEVIRFDHVRHSFINLRRQADNYDRSGGQIHSTKAETGRVLKEL